ncbi:MAG: type II toxin-antitoxin system RelE family toxin [Candidatus Dormibacteraceae bacterium]
MDESYEVVIAANAERDIRRLAPEVRRRIMAGVTVLETGPRSGKRLTGVLGGLWSLRRGDYRVLYRIDDRARRVEVARIGHRRDVYRRG